MDFDRLMEFLNRGRAAQVAVDKVIAEYAPKPTTGQRDAQRRRAGKVRAAQKDRGAIKGRKPNEQA